MSSRLDQLLQLSHELGREERSLAILGEGNTSANATDGTFWVKASGSSLRNIDHGGLTLCHRQPLCDLLGEKKLADSHVEAALMAARVQDDARKPSVEAMFHAWLLSLPGIDFVGHTHPEAVTALLCSPHAKDFAERRLFPDEIVCCGETSVLVPYTDPGLPLAQAIRRAVASHLTARGAPPRVILLENHGLIALGATAETVLAATLMAEKAARITLAANTADGPWFLAPAHVKRIAGRSDEHYRRRALGI